MRAVDKTIITTKYHNKLPPQQLPYSRKNRDWRMAHLQWANTKAFFNYNPVRNSVLHKKINYDLFNGVLHMQDLELVLNPEQVKEKVTPANIQHYPIINSKLNVLLGEESKRVFDFRVVITNPTALSEKEEAKKTEVLQMLQELIADQSQSEEDFNQKLEKQADFFTYEWQDMREVRANCLLNHYMKECNIPFIFNEGFKDGLIVGEEIYKCDIIGGEPTIERIDPLKIRVFKSGYSNRIEDADIIILEDYWSPGRVIDTFYDSLTKKDIEYLEDAPDNVGQASINEVGERDERMGYVHTHMIDDTFEEDNFFFDPFGMFGSATNELLPFDTHGNVRVMQMYWKSRRRIKKVKSYDTTTGKETFSFYPESYVINEDKGEEEWIYYINEAWEGTLIGEEIYINMRPRPIQYNRLSNPSRCHFGIVGSVYNTNNDKPFTLVDMMKPYSYLYDAVHDRLNKVMARNWGKLVQLDLAKVPDKWDIDKWLYFAKHNNIAVVDSFKEGNYGAATGKIAGALNNASNGVIDAELGGIIQQYINTLEFIKMEMSEVAGITRQREGQISNRETVGGVERATLQSSHITEWVFTVHEDVKRRALECFLETAKIALKGRSLKFQYMLSDGSMKIMDIDGDEFAEADYGLVVDNSNGVQELNQKLDMLAQAALQNQAISFSTIMKLYSSVSLIEKQRMVEKDEKELQERQQQMQQQQLEQQQQQAEMQSQLKQVEMQQQMEMNNQDNEAKIMVAQIQAATKEAEIAANNDGIQEPEYSQEAKDKLLESMRQFDKKLELEKQKLDLNKKKVDLDASIKREAIRKRTSTSNK